MGPHRNTEINPVVVEKRVPPDDLPNATKPVADGVGVDKERFGRCGHGTVVRDERPECVKELCPSANPCRH